jgi:hypothetical protein
MTAAKTDTHDLFGRIGRHEGPRLQQRHSTKVPAAKMSELKVNRLWTHTGSARECSLGINAGFLEPPDVTGL